MKFPFWKKGNSKVENEYDLRDHPNAIKLAKDLVKSKNLIVQLDLKTKALSKQNIDKWRTANQVALNYENPKRVLLYPIYDDVMLDSHSKGAIRNRKLKVLGKPFKVVDSEGVINKELTKLLRKRWLKKFISLSLDSEFWGYSLIQFGDIVRAPELKFLDIKLVPREHVIPEYHVLIKDKSDEVKKGIDYLKPPYSDWSIGIGDPDELGLLNVVAKDAISKKWVTVFWDQFAEIFGMPIRIAETSSRNKKEIDKLENMLEKMGSAAQGVFPQGTTVKLIETNRGDAFQVYDKRIARANSEISKAILGQTMTMDDGSSKSQAVVHENVSDDITNADADFIKDICNDDLFPFLIKHGWPLQGYEFDWDETYTYTPKEMKEIEDMILEHYDVDPVYFKEKYGIPVTGKKQVNGTTIEDSQKKKIKLVSDNINALYGITGNETITLSALDFDKEAERIAKAIFEGEFNGIIDPKLTELTFKKLKEAVLKGFGDDLSNLKPGNNEYKMLESLKQNTFHFSAAKNRIHLEELNNLLVKDGELRSFSSFMKEAKKLNTLINKVWLQTEYDTAINSATMARQWVDFESRKESMPNLTFDAVNDKRTRPDHALLDGTTRPMDDPFWDIYYPPLGFR